MAKVSVSEEAIASIMTVLQNARSGLEQAVIDLKRTYLQAGSDWSDKKYHQLGDIIEQASRSILVIGCHLGEAKERVKKLQQAIVEYINTGAAQSSPNVSAYSQPDSHSDSPSAFDDLPNDAESFANNSTVYDAASKPKAVSSMRFQKQSKRDAQTINYSERRALEDYCSDNSFPPTYQRINSYLRNTTSELPDYLHNNVDEMTNAISRHALTSDVVVYRGLNNSRSLFGDYDECSIEELNQRFQGREYIDRGFCSTSISEEGARQFAQSYSGTILEINAPEGAQAFFTGEVSRYHTDEQEILFQRGSVFTINNISEENGIRHVNLTLSGRLS